MSNLQNVKRDISAVYFSTKNTADRYDILYEILEHIDELRKTTVQQIENGSFEIVQEDEILSKIHQILAVSSFMHIDSVKAVVHIDSKVSHVFEELKLDSLDYVEFIMEVEEKFDVVISDYDAEQFNTINDIIRFVTSK